MLRALRRFAPVGAAIGVCSSAVSWASGAGCDVAGREDSPPVTASAAARWAGLEPSRKLRVGVLGATGAVGQRFLRHLEGHPWFEVVALGASERSAGKQYSDAAHWIMETAIPDAVRPLVVRQCDPRAFSDVDFVFSALDADVAGEVEGGFVKAGISVFSNARNFRMQRDVPLVVPPVNPDHLEMVRTQGTFPHSGAFIVTNANCSTTGLVTALEPLERAFGIEAVMVTTLQAVSGAGYPGLSTLDMLDNVVPCISGEEAKLESEYKKIMGDLHGRTEITPPSFRLSATTNRVLVRDGHTLCLSVKLKRGASVEEVERALSEFEPRDPLLARMPSAPSHFVVIAPGGAQGDRPQPRLDRETGGGFTTVVGRVRPCPVFDVKMTVLSHNTVMGAAGSSILNAELATAKKLLVPRPLIEAGRA
jgi:aspartate-semialdehyde dehydrogenase